MKLVFFSGGMNRSGGTERVLSEIANSLASRGYEVVIVSLTGESRSFYSIDERIKMYWIGAKGFTKGILKSLKMLRRIVKDEKPDIWIDVDIILCFYSLPVRGIRHRFKLISWEHFNHNSSFEQNTNLRKIAKKLVTSKSDCMLVLSKDDEKYYRENYKIKKRLCQIYNPTTFEKLPEKTDEEKLIFAAGNIVPVKGFDELVNIWAILENKFPAWRVEIAGQGEEKEKLERIAENKGLKRIHFIGRVENISEYYRKAAIYVMTSRCEGFPMVVLEAMAFSLPIVAFEEKTCVNEMVFDNESGMLVKERSAEKFAEKLELLMKNDDFRQKMGKAAKDQSERFSHEIITDKWEELLKELI